MGKYRNCIFNWLIRKRTTFGWVFFLIVAIFGKGSKMDIAKGLPFIIIGEFLRFLSAGIIKKNEVLTKEGIYSLCRNPLYLGSFLIGIGFSIASNNIWIFLYFFLSFLIIYPLTIKKEEEFLIKKFGEEYSEYRKRVPAFLPIFRRKNIFEKFSIKNAYENGEIINFIVVFLLLFFLLIKTYFKL